MTGQHSKVFHYRDSQCEVIVDERYYPIMITTWIGNASKEAVDWFFVHNDRELARVIKEGQVHAMLTDACAASRPDATARSQIAAKTNEVKARYPEADALRAVSFVVLTNALIRGALTAVGWLVGGMDHEYTSTMEEALLKTKAAFETKKVPWPAGLDPSRYSVSARDAHTGS